MARTAEGLIRYRETMARKRQEAKKNIHDSTLSAVTPNITYSEYFDFNDMQLKLFTNNTATRWATELVAFAKLPGTLKVTEYFINIGCSYDAAMQLCAKYEILDQAYKHSKYIVGNRRERAGLMNELNSSLVHAGLANYDPEWKKLAEWKASLVKDKDVNKGNMTVLIERFPSSDMVPVKEVRILEEIPDDI